MLNRGITLIEVNNNVGYSWKAIEENARGQLTQAKKGSQNVARWRRSVTCASLKIADIYFF